MARYAFIDEPRGGVGLEVIAATPEAVIDAAVTALSLFMWDQQRVNETDSREISSYGFERGTALLALLSEVLYRTENDDWVCKRFTLERMEEIPPQEGIHRKQLRLVGRAYGEPFDATRHQRRFPVQAVLLPKLKFKPHEEGWRFYAVLDA